MKSVFLFLLFLSNVLYAQSPIGASGILFSQTVTPSTPPSGHDQFYFDSTSGLPGWVDSLGSLHFVASSFSDGIVLSGEYTTDVYVNGSASLGANTTVQGDLIVVGTLTNDSGYSLNVSNDCNVGGFNFTPTDPATPQGNVVIGGSFTFGIALSPPSSPIAVFDGRSNNIDIYMTGLNQLTNGQSVILTFTSGADIGFSSPGTVQHGPHGYYIRINNSAPFVPSSGDLFTVQSSINSNFQPNPGQSPALIIGGDMVFVTSSGEIFNGAGQPGANGLNVTVNGSVTGYGNSGWIGGSGSLVVDGGPDTVSSSGGSGGTITIGGAVNTVSVSSMGGPSTNSGQNAGNGGTVYVGQDSFTQGFVVDGGASSGSGGNGGNGGNIYVSGFSFVGAGGLFTANGGACGGSTATFGAGNGGYINPGTGGNFAQLSAVGGDITGVVTANLSAGNGGTYQSILTTAPVIGPINVSGGSVDSGTSASSPFTANCGAGGVISILGSYVSSDPFNPFDFSLYVNGGSFQSTDPNITGSGGTGGTVQLSEGYLTNIYANGGGSSSAIAAAPPGNITVSKALTASGTISLLDGTTGTAASGSASLVLNGNCNINTISAQNRSGILIQAGGSTPVVLKVGNMTDLTQLTNAGNTQTTASLSSSLANSIFTYDVSGNTWYQNTGHTPGVFGVQTTLNGSAGTAVCEQTSNTKVMCYLNGFTDTATQNYVFPFPFTQATPATVYAPGGVSETASTTQVSFTSTLATGYVILEGF